MNVIEIINRMQEIETALAHEETHNDFQAYDMLSEEHAALSNQLDGIKATGCFDAAFVPDTQADTVQDVMIDGMLFVAYSGNRITAELAQRRLDARADGFNAWSDTACTPAYWVHFVRADGSAASALGRI